jgi:diguanylate cyclase (GGDEF)-like protein/PAS domain S-box-containing protein
MYYRCALPLFRGSHCVITDEMEGQIMKPDSSTTADLSCSTPVPRNELARLQALHELRILDTPAEAAFDSAVRLAANACDTPIAMISLIDRERQWCKARAGLVAAETPRHLAFCAHTIMERTLFEVPDTLADKRFANNPLVTGPRGIRYYAGMPLCTSDDMALGSLCIVDYVPRELDRRQREALADLAKLVTALLESRKASAELAQVGLILNEAFDEIIVLYPDSQHIQYANAHALENLGYRLPELQQTALSCVSADYPLADLYKLRGGAVRQARQPLSFEALHVRKDGSTYPVEVRATLSTSTVTPQVILLTNDISGRKLQEEMRDDLAALGSVKRLASRRSFEGRLVRAMQRARMSGKSLALLMIEFGRLTEIRHAYGQQLADMVLAEFGARLAACARASDVVVHLGGDEFVILAEAVDEVNATPSLVARIHRDMQRYFFWEQCQIQMAASVGTVYFDGGDEDADALLVRAADAVNIAILTGTHQQVTPLPGTSASAGMQTPFAAAHMTSQSRH